jgi:hypothetical protein
MIALLFFLLRLLVSPFRSISRLEAENAALDTTPVWPFRRAISLPLSASQMRAVPSQDAVTTRVPSPLNAAVFTRLVWPFRTAISLPLSASQMHAVLSSDYHDHPTLKTVLESMRSLPR